MTGVVEVLQAIGSFFLGLAGRIGALLPRGARARSLPALLAALAWRALSTPAQRAGARGARPRRRFSRRATPGSRRAAAARSRWGSTRSPSGSSPPRPRSSCPRRAWRCAAAIPSRWSAPGGGRSAIGAPVDGTIVGVNRRVRRDPGLVKARPVRPRLAVPARAPRDDAWQDAPGRLSRGVARRGARAARALRRAGARARCGGRRRARRAGARAPRRGGLAAGSSRPSCTPPEAWRRAPATGPRRQRSGLPRPCRGRLASCGSRHIVPGVAPASSAWSRARGTPRLVRVEPGEAPATRRRACAAKARRISRSRAAAASPWSSMRVETRARTAASANRSIIMSASRAAGELLVRRSSCRAGAAAGRPRARGRGPRPRTASPPSASAGATSVKRALRRARRPVASEARRCA